MNTFTHFFIEKNVFGLEEPIQLDGVGLLKAKLDTGNGAFNVLHGTDVEINGNVARFVTDKGIAIEKPVHDTITINVGAGNKEDRPVVLFDVVFGHKKFKGVPFSIGNRAENTHKVLIGKNFIQNELDALIDVSLSYVAKHNLEADYD